MDAVYVVSPFWTNYNKNGYAAANSLDSPYRAENREGSGMPDPDELLDRYSQLVGFDPRKDGGGRDWDVAKVFHLVRGGTISHGIQARTISGQASSDFSQIYFENTRRSLDAALVQVRNLKEKQAVKAKI